MLPIPCGLCFLFRVYKRPDEQAALKNTAWVQRVQEGTKEIEMMDDGLHNLNHIGSISVGSSTIDRIIIITYILVLFNYSHSIIYLLLVFFILLLLHSS